MLPSGITVTFSYSVSAHKDDIRKKHNDLLLADGKAGKVMWGVDVVGRGPMYEIDFGDRKLWVYGSELGANNEQDKVGAPTTKEVVQTKLL